MTRGTSQHALPFCLTLGSDDCGVFDNNHKDDDDYDDYDYDSDDDDETIGKKN